MLHAGKHDLDAWMSHDGWLGENQVKQRIKGYLRLSLVSCPIALYPASSLREKVSFNRINRKTGNRLKQQNVDSETGEVVPREDIGRGYEVGKNQYLVVEDEEFEAIQIESTRTIDIDQFVPRSEIDERYIDSP